MEIKKYSEMEDFPFIALWATARDLPLPNPDHYPECGMVVSVDGKRVCSGFMFRTDAKFAIIGGIMSDPGADPGVRNVALDVLIAALLDLARQCGFLLTTVSANNDRLLDRYKRHGFDAKEKGLTIMLRGEPCL